MNHERYKQAVKYDASSPSQELLKPYWDRLYRIAQADDPLAVLEEEVLAIEEDGTLVFVTGGPHIEVTPSGEIRGSWGDRWIYSQPLTVADRDVLSSVRDLIKSLLERV